MTKKMTSAYANKMLKSLQDDKAFWLAKEQESFIYTAAINEEPVIPEYDYEEVKQEIEKIDEQICKIKHAINYHNSIAQVLVGEQVMSVDTILVKMAQMNQRLAMLDIMRKRLPKMRERPERFSPRNASPEYTYINYDLEVVKADYEALFDKIMMMQIALDKYNQTYEFEVEM